MSRSKSGKSETETEIKSETEGVTEVDSPQDNPYEAPLSSWPTINKPTSGPKTFFWSLRVVLGCCAIFAVLGMALGTLLGVMVPGYYRSIFAGSNPNGVDPVSVGIGLGLTQGAVFGGFVGVALVALYYWYSTRIDRIDT